MNWDSLGEVRLLRVGHVAVAKPVHVGCLQHNSIESVAASGELSTLQLKGRTDEQLLIKVPNDKTVRTIQLRCWELV
jgi:hypothetical protein